jgi:DNA-binding NarL/FixJ family response regulator
MNVATKRVMIVDDNRAIRSALRNAFLEHGFTTFHEAENGREAIATAKSHNPHLIILDISMPVMNGVEAAPQLLKLVPRVCIIFYSTYASSQVEQIAKKLGVHATVSKSESVHKLVSTACDLLSSGENAA